MNTGKRTLGSAIFAEIENNDYLGKLYARLLQGYGMHAFNMDQGELFTNKEKADILRFADILSKSNDPEKSDGHKIWAQEIAILMNELYPDDALVKA